MWKQTAITLALSFAVPYTLTSAEVRFEQHQAYVAAQQQAAVRAEARHRAVEAQVGRYQAQSMLLTAQQRDAAEQRAQRLQQALDAMTAERDKLQDQVITLTSYTSGYGSGGGGAAPGPTSSGGNHMAFGYCTWYVANKRYIPWFGNAGTWFWSARAYGWPTGYSPRPGAIEVAALSWAGHVAWVEQVYPNGTYMVSEMNYSGWDLVDWRLVIPGREAVIGYIY